MTEPTIVGCIFVLRTIAEGGYHYLQFGTTDYPTTYPPLVGDYVEYGDDKFRVIAREWTLPLYDTPHWRKGDTVANAVLLTLIVEHSEGAYVNYVPHPDELPEDTDARVGV